MPAAQGLLAKHCCSVYGRPGQKSKARRRGCWTGSHGGVYGGGTLDVPDDLLEFPVTPTPLPAMNQTPSAPRTRFAPSPTGYLHIGGVRTALFNWLVAKGQGGQFILRIDDTDQQRNVEQALQPILEGLRWLGLDWDEGPEIGGSHGPYYQSQRGQLYQQAVQKLLETGAAYWDYATPEEVAQEREAAQREKRPWRYSRRWMAATEEQRRRFEAEGRRGVVRLKMPQEGTCVFDDLIRGRVEVPWAGEQDHVIQRADGSVLYHLASVVDDYHMQITHVIRAEEHLSNTPRQIFIAQALGYPLPRYAHLPYVAEPGSRNKLSKRKLKKYLNQPDFRKVYEAGTRIMQALGRPVDPETFNPVMVQFYRAVGYLPEAVLNYLVLLGWSLDERTEDFSREEMLRHFSLDRVNRAPASFDPAKLLAFQQRWMQRVPLAEKVRLVLPYLQEAGLVPNPLEPNAPLARRVEQVVHYAEDRITVAGDILQFAYMFQGDEEFPYNEKDFQKRLLKPAEAAELLEAFAQELEQLSPEQFLASRIQELMQQFVEKRGIKIGQIIHAVRVAVTGQAVGFGLFETLEVLGRQATLGRIRRALRLVQEKRSGE